MQIITADQIPVADNPHGVDVRHLYKTKDVVVSQITLQPGEIVKPHKAPVDAFFYVLEGSPADRDRGRDDRGHGRHARPQLGRTPALHPQRERRPGALPRRQDAEPGRLTARPATCRAGAVR